MRRYSALLLLVLVAASCVTIRGTIKPDEHAPVAALAVPGKRLEVFRLTTTEQTGPSYMVVRVDKKGTTTKCAFKNMTVEANGWKTGVRAESFVDQISLKDGFRIFSTGGAGGFRKDRLLGVIVDGEFTRDLSLAPGFDHVNP